MHVAILDVDIPVPAVYSTRGLYSTQFHTLLYAAAERLNISTSTIHTTAFDTAGGCLPPLQSLRTTPRNTTTAVTPEELNPLAQPIDGILITGAAAAAYEPHKHPWIPPLQDFIQTVHREYPHVRLFGSCFGHQIIARALLTSPSSYCREISDHEGVSTANGNVNVNVNVEACPHGYEMGLTTVSLNPGFTAQFPTVCEKLPVRDEMRLQMIHGDWVVIPENDSSRFGLLPAPWINIGGSAHCPVQGLYCPGRVLTYQGHFEFNVFTNRETCVEFGRRNGWDAKEVQRYVGLMEKGRVDGQEDDADDSKVAAEIVLLFYLGA